MIALMGWDCGIRGKPSWLAVFLRVDSCSTTPSIQMHPCQDKLAKFAALTLDSASPSRYEWKYEQETTTDTDRAGKGTQTRGREVGHVGPRDRQGGRDRRSLAAEIHEPATDTDAPVGWEAGSVLGPGAPSRKTRLAAYGRPREPSP